MAKLAELRKKAKGMGIAAAAIRRATTASELQSIIDEHKGGSKGKAKAKAKAKGKGTSAAKKNSAAKKSTAKKNSGRKASAPAKSKGAKAKRQSNSNREAKGGRNLLGKVNFSKTDGWNPREDSAPDLIVKALKRFKGDRTKVFNYLKGDIWDFVQKKKQNGDKRTKAEAEAMLRYRISRTAFDFAVRTGQHEPSDNRVEYGTGGTGNGVFKRGGSKGKSKGAQSRSKPARKQTAKKSVRKPAGRKKGGKGRAKARR